METTGGAAVIKAHAEREPVPVIEGEERSYPFPIQNAFFLLGLYNEDTFSGVFQRLSPLS